MLIDIIKETKESLPIDEIRSNIIDLYEKIRKEKNRSQFMRNLMIDLFNDDDYHGEIERAYRKEFYNKWGKNYVYSLLRFHVLEQCGNVKCMSLQLYDNEYFSKFRKIGNDVFMNLPIPESNKFNQKKSSPMKKKKRRIKKAVKGKSPKTNDSDDNETLTKKKKNKNSNHQLNLKTKRK